MTLWEIAKEGVAYWELSMIFGARQMLATGGEVVNPRLAERESNVQIGNLSAPANLEPSDSGSDWHQFWLGKARLVIWPKKARP